MEDVEDIQDVYFIRNSNKAIGSNRMIDAFRQSYIFSRKKKYFVNTDSYVWHKTSHSSAVGKSFNDFFESRNKLFDRN